MYLFRHKYDQQGGLTMKKQVLEKKDKTQKFLKNQNECHLCGNKIETYMEYVSFTRFAVEKAQCCNCMTLVRVQNHSIQ